MTKKGKKGKDEKKSTKKPASNVISILKNRIQEEKLKKLQQEEEEKKRKQKEEEDEKLRMLEEEKEQKRKELVKELEAKKKLEKKIQEKKSGKYLTHSQRQKLNIARARLGLTILPSSSWADEDCDPVPTLLVMTSEIKEKEKERLTETKADEKISKNIRPPICCVLGHVDSGKTRFLETISQLDKSKNESKEEKKYNNSGEAGGITQRINSVFISSTALSVDDTGKEREKTMNVLPGILFLDTPGHQVFSHLRSQSVEFCDLAIIIVDIMHGLKPQTIEVLSLLKKHKVPFLVVMNKIDLLAHTNSSSPGNSKTKSFVMEKFSQAEEKVGQIITSLAAQGFNSCLYQENKDLKSCVSLIPVSSLTVEKIPEFLSFLTNLLQTRLLSTLVSKVDYDDNNEEKKQQVEVKAVVMETRVMNGFGHVIDILLLQGELKKGDKIMVGGNHEPIVTIIRNLLMASVTSNGNNVNTDITEKVTATSIKGLVTIVGKGLEDCTTGCPLFNISNLQFEETDEYERMGKMVQRNITSIKLKLKDDKQKVWIQASNLGVVEAIIDILAEHGVGVLNFGIGTLNKKYFISAAGARLEDEIVILVFDVEISEEVKKMVDSTSDKKDEKDEKSRVKIFQSDVVYQLTDQVLAYFKKLKSEQQSLSSAIFPCVLQILGEEYVYRKQDPLLIGVKVVEGLVKIGTPIAVLAASTDLTEGKVIELGHVVSIKSSNGRDDRKEAKKGMTVCLKIQHASDGTSATSSSASACYGRNFDYKNQLVSKLSRESIDALKKDFKEEVSLENWKLVAKLKKELGIP
jgi:translation initiation factor 5B